MKKQSLVAAFFSLFIFSFLVSDSAIAQSGPVYIKGGFHFNTEQMEMVRNEGILISGGRINKIGGKSEQPLPGTEIIELQDDEYLLPGIVDVHGHFRMDSFGSDERRSIDEFKYNSLVFLANGVTSVFANGVYYPYMELGTKELINSGRWTGPRIWASGPYFGRARPDWNSEITKQEIYEEVDYWASLGVDGFKSKGGSPETIKHLVQRAHIYGLKVAGHLGSGSRNSTNSITAINLGIDRVEHIMGGYVLDSTRSAYPVWNKVDTSSTNFKRTVQHYLDHRVFFDATMIAPVYFTTLKEGFDYWEDEKAMFTPYVRNMLPAREDQEESELMSGLYEAMQRSTKAFYDAGGGDLITLGTDGPSHGYYLSGFAAHREMHTMVLAGIPEAAVLKISSQNSANALGKGNILGSIEAGKLADFYVVKGNPLKDITHTRNVQWVMKSGEVYEPQKILEQVKGNIGPSSSSEVNDWFKYPELTKKAKEIQESSLQ